MAEQQLVLARLWAFQHVNVASSGLRIRVYAEVAGKTYLYRVYRRQPSSELAFIRGGWDIERVEVVGVDSTRECSKRMSLGRRRSGTESEEIIRKDFESLKLGVN